MRPMTTDRGVRAPAAAIGGPAAELLREITGAPERGLTAGVRGAGGCGKTALLAELGRSCRAAGGEVVDDVGEVLVAENAAAKRDLTAAWVLIDDAHLLGEDALRGLLGIARTPGARLVAAYRPDDSSAALTELVTALDRQVQLSGLARSELADRVREERGIDPDPAWVGWLHAQTGGIPRQVDRMLAALELDAVHIPAHRAVLPERALDQVQHDLQRLPDVGLRCVLAMAVGAAAHPELLASLTGMAPAGASAALASVRAAGLVDTGDALLPVVRAAVLRQTPWDQRLPVVRALVELRIARGGALLPLVRPLLDAEVALLPDTVLAAGFAAAAGEVLTEDPVLAQRLLLASTAAGTPRCDVVARMARAAAFAGDVDESLRLADEVLLDAGAAQRELAARTAAAVLAHRGLLERCARMCAWSVRNLPWPGAREFAAQALIATGDPSAGEQLLDAPDVEMPPTSAGSSAADMTAGVRESVSGSASRALSTLVRSASLADPAGGTQPVPESPAAVAAIVALHCGEPDVAESVLDRAVSADAGGPLLRTRHALLAAWIPLLRGDTGRAREAIAATAADSARDRLLRTAVEAGIASRDNDVAGMAAARGGARQVVAEHAVDLFTVLPLGELVVAAARLRDQEWLAPHLASARELLSRIGDPPLWTAPLDWKCLQAAVILDDREQVATHAVSLERAAGHNPFAAALSAAAHVWQELLRGRIERERTETAARGLHSAGLGWDGARLAGQAALHTADRQDMAALLECARALQGKPTRPKAVSGGLSEREKDVARLVLSGMTYKQIGQRLFISAKTVEHHVGRMKQRLGCADRDELLSRLRELLV